MARSRRTHASPPSRVPLKQIVHASKALAHPVRLRILAMLKGRRLCVCQMTSVLGLAYPTVSGHLNALRQSGLAVESKEGKIVFYQIDRTSPFYPVVSGLLSLADADETTAQDEAIVGQVLRVPCETVTAAGCDLGRLGIRRPTSSGGSRTRAPLLRRTRRAR
jgi:DNA-binding transcriptional ArsR family regulator